MEKMGEMKKKDKWGKMGGGGWGKMGQKWDNSGHSTWHVVEEDGTKIAEKWDEMPMCHSPIFPIFPEVEDLPRSSLCKNQLTAPTVGKMRLFAIHHHSLPRRLVQILVIWHRVRG